MCFCAASLVALLAAPAWQTTGTNDQTLEARFPPPAGFTRGAAPSGSLAAFLRSLPLLAGNPDVMLYDGTAKRYQRGHLAVVDIDVGTHDLQQCADAVMRLLAEYRYAEKQTVCFTATSGDPVPWERWRRGERPALVSKAAAWAPKIAWSPAAKPDDSHASFRAYLDALFTWAGTLSLHRDLTAIEDSAQIEPGDVFVVGGSPGHAVLVVDVARNAAGEERFMLVQSYMPAQQIHVLRGQDGAWYTPPSPGKDLSTPEWTFPPGSRRRYTRDPCR